MTIILTGCSGESNNQSNNGGNTNGENSAAGNNTNELNESQQEPYQVIAEGLQIPWSIAFAGDTIYLSEREGDIVMLKDGNFERQKVSLDKPVHHEGEGGFLGLLLAPDFSESGLAYAYHTYSENG